MDTTLASLVTNKRRVSALKSLGIITVGDALTYYPFRVTEPVPLRAIREAAPGQQMAFAAVIRDMRVVPMNARRGYRLEATVDDADFARSRRVPGSTARLTFFSYRKSYVDWVSMRLRAGTSVVVSGMPGEYMGQLQFTHPEILTVAPGSAGAGAGLEGYARDAASGNGAFAGSTDPYASAQSAYPPAATAPSGAALKYDADTVQEALTRVCRPRPVYHASSRISSEHIHETILGLLWMMGARTSSTPDGQLAGAGAAGIVAPATDTIAVQNGEEKSGTTAESGAEALSQSIPDVLPESVRKAKNLMHRAEAFLAIHDPASTARFKEAIETLRYEEAFVSQTSLLKSRQHAHKSSAHPCPLNEALETARASVGEAVAEPSTQPEASERGSATDLPDLPNLPNLRDRFIASLPFTLTAGQSQVVDDIASDLERDWPMQRLLQGEVGSGKTVVALAAMLQAVGAGYQAVLVAPTQVLAEQHYETISKMVSGLTLAQPGAKETDAAADVEGAMGASGASTVSSSKVTAEIPVTLLTGGMKLAARRKALAAAASGEPGIIVATHAAFSKTFQAPHLALVVIDEQHRFGVEQRESLNAKTDDGTTPHLLVMTATPIPRTAAMTWFGDLDISWLTELPGGRKPIRTVVVNEADAATMGRMFAHIRARVDAGERAYIVCPRIDADDEEIAQSISVIFLFNVIAALIFPTLGGLLGLSNEGFGLFAGTAINDTSSVTAAAQAWDGIHGSNTLDAAAIVKLTRTLAIIPITLVLAFVRTRRERHSAEGAKVNLKKIFPFFVLFFLLASVVTTVFHLPAAVTNPLKEMSKFFIVMAMAAIGLNTNIIKLVKTGGKPIFMGLCCWIGIAGVSLLMQHLLGIW